MNNPENYAIPAPLMQGIISTLMNLPGTQAFGLLYDIKGLCAKQEQEASESALQAHIDSQVQSALAAAQPVV